MIWAIRAGAFAAALFISLVVFLFWGKFGTALVRALEVPVVASSTHATPNDGVVSVSVLPNAKPAVRKPVCDKDHPCK